MIRAVINRMLKAALSELFIDASSDAVHVSMGADMFADSKIHFNNLTFRPDVFDAMLHPLQLVSGHLGSLSIEGIAELALGGKVRCNVDGLFLLFRVDEDLDAQRVQFLKKILIELTANNIQHVIIHELLKKVQGFADGKDPDFKKKRALFMRSWNYLFNSLQLTIKTVHVRIEIKNENVQQESSSTANFFSAFGLTLPIIKLSPGASIRPPGLNKSDPACTFVLRGLQVYVDYDRESYASEGSMPVDILKSFQEKWRSESHTALLLPFDLDVYLGAEIQKRTGLFMLKVLMSTPAINMVVDSRQLEVIRRIYSEFVLVGQRSRQLSRIRVAFTRDEIPRVYGTGGSHILPQLSSGQFAYPSNMIVMRNAFGQGLVALLKAKMGPRWAKALWKHLIRLVMEDVRLTMPLGKWLRVANLAFARKDYAFLYCKLLKKSKDTGNFIYDVNANADPETVRRLFEYEMKWPVVAISQFRTLGHMIALVELFNSKRLQTKISRAGGMMGALTAYENVNIAWRDLLRIQSELFEASQESAFKSFSKRANSSGVGRLMVGDDVDDEASVISDSVTSAYSMSTGVSSTRQTTHQDTSGSQVPSAAQSISSNSSNISVASSFSNLFSRRTSSNASASTPAGGTQSSSTTAGGTGQGPTKAGVFHSTMRVINAVKQVASLPASDDLDAKIFGRSEILAFGDIFGKSEPDVHATVIGKFDRAAYQASLSTVTEKVSPTNLDFRLQDPSPTSSAIVDAVRWVLLRHQPALTIVPPDFSVSIESYHFTFRLPLKLDNREDLLSLKLEKISMSGMISSQAFVPLTATSSSGLSSPTAGPKGNSKVSHVPNSFSSVSNPQSPQAKASGVVRSLRGFASLVGSLIQLKAEISSVRFEIFVKDHELVSVLNGRHADELSVKSRGPAQVDTQNAGDKVLAYIEQQRSHYAELGVDGGTGTGAVTILQAIEVAEKEEEKKRKEPRGFPLFSCSESFLTLCVMLDFDENTEGAADVQVQIGRIKSNLNGALLSRVMDEEAMASMYHASCSINEFYELQALGEESAYIIDREHRLPSAVMSIFGVKSTRVLESAFGNGSPRSFVAPPVISPLATSTSSAPPVEDAASEVSEQSSEPGEDTTNALMNYYSTVGPSPNSENNESTLKTYAILNTTGVVEDEVLEHTSSINHDAYGKRSYMSSKRQDMIDNLNYTKWHVIARHYIPTVLTVLIRSSPVTVNAVSSSTIRNFVLAFVHRLADRASKRQTPNNAIASSLLSLQSGLTGFMSFLQLLTSARDMNRRDLEKTFEADNLAVFSIPALEAIIYKTQTPSPMIDATVFGVGVKLPVSDDTICQILALILSTWMPFYR